MPGEGGLRPWQGPEGGHREGHSVQAPLRSCQEEPGGRGMRADQGGAHGSGVCRASSTWGQKRPRTAWSRLLITRRQLSVLGFSTGESALGQAQHCGLSRPKPWIPCKHCPPASVLTARCFNVQYFVAEPLLQSDLAPRQCSRAAWKRETSGNSSGCSRWGGCLPKGGGLQPKQSQAVKPTDAPSPPLLSSCRACDGPG